jgi:hypothetical protein
MVVHLQCTGFEPLHPDNFNPFIKNNTMEKETVNKYFYRLPMESAAGGRVKELIVKGEEAWNAAADLAKELGAVRFTPNPAFLVGGIGQLYFSKKPNERAYQTIRRRGHYFECYPNRGKEAGAKIFERILKPPAVHFKELELIFGKMEQGSLTPAFFDYREDIYLASATPLELEGLVETNEAVWAAMNAARKIVEKEKENQPS